MDSTHSHTKSSGVSLGQPSRWTDGEQRVWVPVLFLGGLLVYAGRGALPVTVVEISYEFEWDKRISVSNSNIYLER